MCGGGHSMRPQFHKGDGSSAVIIKGFRRNNMNCVHTGPHLTNPDLNGIRIRCRDVMDSKIRDSFIVEVDWRYADQCFYGQTQSQQGRALNPIRPTHWLVSWEGLQKSITDGSDLLNHNLLQTQANLINLENIVQNAENLFLSSAASKNNSTTKRKQNYYKIGFKNIASTHQRRARKTKTLSPLISLTQSEVDLKDTFSQSAHLNRDA